MVNKIILIFSTMVFTIGLGCLQGKLVSDEDYLGILISLLIATIILTWLFQEYEKSVIKEYKEVKNGKRKRRTGKRKE